MPLVLIIITPSYHKVMHALSLALRTASVGEEVHIFFTYGGILRLKRGHVDHVGDETDVWIRDKIREGIIKGSIPKISELLKDLASIGCNIYACPSAMAFHDISKNDLINEVTAVRSPSSFISENIERNLNIIYV